MPRKSTIAKEQYNPSRTDPRRDLANLARIIMGIFRRPSQRGNVLTSNLAAHCPLCLTMLLCLAASGCVALDTNESASTPPAVAVQPDEKKLAELVSAAFTTAKLSGAPEVSPVRATHDTQIGDWAFCIRSRNADQMPEYAVLIRNNTILEIRSFVLIDGCYKETYRPIEITAQRGVSGETNVDLSKQSRSRHQKRAPQ
jgi:hypothetical protein